ncbi:MAG: TolC family protein [Acidobacteriaceae bacterium]|nr:TolC family protein [Acidobacteriaceae bacterium]
MIRKTLVAVLAACLTHGQDIQNASPSAQEVKALTDGWGTIIRGYKTPPIDPVRLLNSPRFGDLVREGKLYLTLQDAIALAVENNLDIELERYTPQIAETEVLRAEAGNLLRGIPTTVQEGPPGVGPPQVAGNIEENGALPLLGASAPALNNLTGPGTTTDLSIIGSIPLSTGPALPDLDPTIVANSSWNHTSDPQNTVFLPNLLSLNANTTIGSLGIQKGFTSGATVSLTWNTTYQTINDPLYLYNPATYSNINLTFTQPLLQGFGVAVNERYIRIARNNRNVSQDVFKQQVITTVYAVIRLYWDFVSLMEDVRVRGEAVSSADRLLADTRQSLSEGTAAPIDVSRAQAEVARRHRDLDVARTLARLQSQILKDYITRTAVDPAIAAIEVVPIDRPEFIEDEKLPALEELVATGLRLRPDLAQARLQLDNSQITLKGSRNAVLPQLNLIATAQNNALIGDPNANTLGLAGGARPGPNPFFLGSYSDAMRQIFHRNFPDYGAGVSLNIPLANRSARADVARDQLQLRQQEIRLRELEKRAQLEITNALIAVQQSRDTYRAAQQERMFEEVNVQAETERLTVGASTSYLVIQYQRDLTAARSAEVSALSSYVEAKATLQRAIGTILDENGVRLDEALRGTVERPSLPPGKR